MAQPFYHKASVQVALVSGTVALLIATATITHQRSALVEDNKELKSQLTTQTSRIQELELELLPFRTLAIQKFNRADIDTMKTLADTMTALQADYSRAVLKIADQQNQIEALQLRTSPRSITEDQRAALMESLRLVPKGEISVTGDYTDAEARGYARQIEDLLRDANFEVPGFTQSGRVTLSIGSPGAFVIVNNAANQPPLAGLLQETFQRAGIELQGKFDPNIASVSNRVYIWVGQKP